MKFRYRSSQYLSIVVWVQEGFKITGKTLVMTIKYKSIPPPSRLEKIIRWFHKKLGFSGAF